MVTASYLLRIAYLTDFVASTHTRDRKNDYFLPTTAIEAFENGA